MPSMADTASEKVSEKSEKFSASVGETQMFKGFWDTYIFGKYVFTTSLGAAHLITLSLFQQLQSSGRCLLRSGTLGLLAGFANT